jgi:hypothetical protein
LNILVIPDSHAHPEHNNRRYEWLGHMILDTKPDVVVDIGDFWDFPSLSSYESGAKKAFEGRQYKKDLNAGLDAQDRLFTVVRRAKRKLPRFIRTLGNHEDRITRAVDTDPVLNGTIGLEDLSSKQYGFEEYPFLQEVEVEGVHFAHYFVSGIAGRAISGEHPGYSLISKRLSSSVQGHSHLYDHCVRADGNGKRVHGLTVGCYQDYDAEWAGPVNRMWSRGVAVLKNVEAGDFDLEWVSLRHIKTAYGGLEGA